MKTHTLTPTAEHIAKVATHLRTGGIAAMPTETVYGLAGAISHESALAAIFETKERPKFDPLIVHVSEKMYSLSKLEKAGIINVSAIPSLLHDKVENLIRMYWPGPLTLVLPKLPKIPDLATSGLPTVAVRMPKHKVALALIQQTGIPLAAPSANRFGRISPTSAEDVQHELNGRIPYILDGGRCEIGLESTVVGIQDDQFVLYRPGGISAESLQLTLGDYIHRAQVSAEGDKPQASPGTLTSHYAPSKPLYIVDPKSDSLPPKVPHVVGVLAFQGNPLFLQQSWEDKVGGSVVLRVLSEKGDTAEAAKNLFSYLRQLDESSAGIIIAEPCPYNTGLGYAISDRLARAAAARS